MHVLVEDYQTTHSPFIARVANCGEGTASVRSGVCVGATIKAQHRPTEGDRFTGLPTERGYPGWVQAVARTHTPELTRSLRYKCTDAISRIPMHPCDPPDTKAQEQPNPAPAPAHKYCNHTDCLCHARNQHETFLSSCAHRILSVRYRLRQSRVRG